MKDYSTIDSVIEIVKRMAKDTLHDDRGYPLTNMEAWEVRDYNETIDQVVEKIRNAFKLSESVSKTGL